MDIIRIDRDLRISESDVKPLYWLDAKASLCWNIVHDTTTCFKFLYLTQKGNWILLSKTDANDPIDLISSFTAALVLLPRIKEIALIQETSDGIALALHRRTVSGPPGPYTEQQRKALQEAINYVLLGEL